MTLDDDSQIGLTSILYTAEATVDFGREGKGYIEGVKGDFDLVKPPGMGGVESTEGVNPEQLFALGYAACFHGSLLFVSRREKIDLQNSTVTASVSIGPRETGGNGLGVTLVANLPEVDAHEAQKLMEAAHQVCPYSKAIGGNVLVKLVVSDSVKDCSEPIASLNDGGDSR